MQGLDDRAGGGEGGGVGRGEGGGGEVNETYVVNGQKNNDVISIAP